MKAPSTSKPEQRHHHGSSDRGGHGQGQRATAAQDSRTELEQQQGLLSLMAGSPRLHRQCSCGFPSAGSGSCAACEAKATGASSQVLQKQLAIGATDDPLEREADRVAEQVLAVTHPPALTSAPPRIQRHGGHADPTAQSASARVERVLAGSGRPLDSDLQQDMEQRFEHDFSGVRVHSDAQAEQSALEVNANAYTVGRSIVFGAGRFAPETHAGLLLLAHELTHVVQQSGADGTNVGGTRGLTLYSRIPHQVLPPTSVGSGPKLQRKCHATELGPPAPDCTPSQDGVVGWQFEFKVGCDDLLLGEEAKISKLKAGNQLKIHGFASKEGAADFNRDLSCHRANRIADMVRKLRADCPVIGVFKHGASPVSTPGMVKDVNPPDFWRSVIIEEVKPPQESGEQWLDPRSSINGAWALYRRAKANPTQPNLMLVSAWRLEMKDWLTSIGKTLAPQGAKLTRGNLDDYRRFYSSAEQLWIASDQLLALHKYPDAAKDTYTEWAVGSGKDQGDKYHAKGVPAGAKYHVDIFGEGYFQGAINVGLAERTSTTGIYGSRVPNLIYRRFSSKDANALPIADHTADLVTSENGPIGFPGIAEEIARIIAPRGTIVLYNPISEEGAHDKVAKTTHGTVKKNKSDRTIQTTIIVPGL